MPITWNRKYKPKHIVDRLESSRVIKSNGEISFEGFAYEECCAYIYDFLVFPSEIPESEGRAIVFRGIQEVGKKGPVTEKSIIREVNKRCETYLQRASNVYFLATLT